MSNLDPGDSNPLEVWQDLNDVMNSILDLPPEALADETTMLPLCKDLAEVIETQRTLIERIDEFFHETLTTTEALEALAEAGIPLPDPKSVTGTLEKQGAQLSKLEALDVWMLDCLSPEGRRAVSAHMIEVRRVRLIINAITDRYDDLMDEDEGI